MRARGMPRSAVMRRPLPPAGARRTATLLIGGQSRSDEEMIGADDEFEDDDEVDEDADEEDVEE